MSTFARTARVSHNNSQPNISAVTIDRDAVVVKKPASRALSGTTTPKEGEIKGKDGVKVVIREMVKEKEERVECCDEAEGKGKGKGKKEGCGCVEMEELEK
ncbi:hypothetical protein HBI23_183990 [Parastagonospora nodorum]|nr:hypothetical protein HBI47_077850 [Parastagonospora nodorum]KAH5647074.1 hypothetical protein HBI23_183990 [Parastagonospora nodorum]KAH6308370.1 hypothetical protein HBI39_085460 [Parastagonospora nodorum]